MKLKNNNAAVREYILVHEDEIVDQMLMPAFDPLNPSTYEGGAETAVQYFKGKPGIIYFALGQQDDRYKKWRKG